MKTFTKNKKSFALILAVFVLLAFSITGMTVVSVLSRRTANYSGQIDSLRASYAAEAARSYYLEKISFVTDFTTDPDAAVFSKTLGGATCSISYKTPSARSATIVFTGTTTTNRSYEITRLVEENSRTIDPSRVTTPTIVDQIRKFNLIVWGGFDYLNNDSTYIILSRTCTGCDHCMNPGSSYNLFGQNFFANTYFNLSLYPVGRYTCGCCCCCFFDDTRDDDPLNNLYYSSENRSVWGASGNGRNLYVNGNMFCCGIYQKNDLTTPYGVWGRAYLRTGGASGEGGSTGLSYAFHQGWYTCGTNDSNAECNNWPTVIPTMDLTYYNSMLSKAAIPSVGSFTIDNSSALRQLTNRNIYVNGNVTISTTSAAPLQGPGNIIATGTITISDGAYIADKIGLIALGNITIGKSTRIGGTYNSTYDLINGAGILIYSRSGTVSFGLSAVAFAEGSRVKAFCVAKDSTTATPGVSFNFSRTSPTYPCSGTGTYSQLQGLVYAERMPAPAHLGRIYGNALIEKIPTDVGKSGTLIPLPPAIPPYPTAGLGLGNIYDTYTIDKAGSGHGTTIAELPLRIRGLYNLLITTP